MFPPTDAGGDIALLLAALHGDRMNRLIGIGAMAGSRYTVLPDLPDVFDPASFANLTLAQQVRRARCAGVGVAGWAGLLALWALGPSGLSCPAVLRLPLGAQGLL